VKVDDIAIIAMRVADYVPPTWPQGPIPEQAHLDIPDWRTGISSANAAKMVLDLRLRVRQDAERGTRTLQDLE